MRRVLGAMFLVGILLLPALPTQAKPLEVTTSTFASSSVSSTISGFSNWLERTLGINLYEILTKIVNVLVLVTKVAINLLLEILPKIRDFLSAY